MKGNIKTFALTSILQLLSTDRKTGVLRLNSNDDEVKIFFNDGNIVYAMGSKKEGRVGHLLRRKGMISDEQLKEGLKLAKQRKQALGKVLVDKGYISIKTLKEIIHGQVEDVLLNLFYWDDGEFEYEDVALNLKAMVVTQINIMSLILEASRRIDEMSVFKKHIKHDGMVFKLVEHAQESAEEVRMQTNEWRVLALVDGKRNVRDLVNDSEFDTFTVYKILHSLLSYQLIEPCKESKKKGGGKLAADFTAAVTIYHETLQVARKNLVAELGRRAYALFETSKPTASPEQEALFKSYDINNPPSTNINAVLSVLEQYQNSDEALSFLIKSFNAYVANVLKETPVILEAPVIRDLTKEIEKTLPYFKNYITDTLEKHKIIESLQAILTQLERAVEHKEKQQGKSSGLLSMFKK